MISEETRYCYMDTPLGTIMTSAQSEAVTGLWFVGQHYFPQKVEQWIEDPTYPVLVALQDWITRYFGGKKPEPDFPLAPRGTPFQKSVWGILRTIPYGTLSTYGAIARQLAESSRQPSTSARAVGNAVGHNPISLVIPCHRVIGSSGKLTGYAGGLEKKHALLRLEGSRL